MYENIVNPYYLGDVGMLNHEARKQDNLNNMLIMVLLIAIATTSMSVLTYNLFVWESKLANALIIMAIIACILEILIFRVIAWWIYVSVRKCIEKWRRRQQLKKRKLLTKQIMGYLTKRKNEFKELFKRYPKTFITSDVNYEDMRPETGAQTVFLDPSVSDFEYQVGAIPSCSSGYDEQFGPRN